MIEKFKLEKKNIWCLVNQNHISIVISHLFLCFNFVGRYPDIIKTYLVGLADLFQKILSYFFWKKFFEKNFSKLFFSFLFSRDKVSISIIKLLANGTLNALKNRIKNELFSNFIQIFKKTVELAIYSIKLSGKISHKF